MLTSSPLAVWLNDGAAAQSPSRRQPVQWVEPSGSAEENDQQSGEGPAVAILKLVPASAITFQLEAVAQSFITILAPGVGGGGGGGAGK